MATLPSGTGYAYAEGMSGSEQKLEILSGEALRAALAELPDWREKDSHVVSAFKFKKSATAVEFMGKVGAAAESAHHHPDLEWRWNTVFLAISTHSEGTKVTRKDTDLAEKLSVAASELGGTAEPERYGEQFKK